MRKFRHFISSILISILILSSSFSVFANSTNTYNYSNIQLTQNEIEAIQDSFNNLNSKERAIFLNEIVKDDQLLEFHKDYIDPNCNLTKPRRVKALSEFKSGLQALSLPWPVYYSLILSASGIVAAGIDGPLPIGDIYAIFANGPLLVVCSIYWSSIEPCIDDIKDLFYNLVLNAVSDAYDNAQNVVDAISDMFSDAENRANDTDDEQIENEKDVVENMTDGELEETTNEKVEQAAQKTLEDMTAEEISNLTPEELEAALPEGWSYNANGPNGDDYIHIKTPSGDYKVRIDPADNTTRYRHIHIFDDVGNPLDINGNVVDEKSPDAHIPYSY